MPDIIGHCEICGKEIQHASNEAYFYKGVVKCMHHPGVEEWYEECCRESDTEELGHPIDWDKLVPVKIGRLDRLRKSK